jgi:hypothetical protein
MGRRAAPLAPPGGFLPFLPFLPTLWPTNPLTERFARALFAAGPEGLTRSQIRGVVGSNNVPKDRIDAALTELVRRDLAVRIYRHTGGRSAETWIAAQHTPAAPGAGELVAPEGT